MEVRIDTRHPTSAFKVEPGDIAYLDESGNEHRRINPASVALDTECGKVAFLNPKGLIIEIPRDQIVFTIKVSREERPMAPAPVTENLTGS